MGFESLTFQSLGVMEWPSVHSFTVTTLSSCESHVILCNNNLFNGLTWNVTLYSCEHGHTKNVYINMYKYMHVPHS